MRFLWPTPNPAGAQPPMLSWSDDWDPYNYTVIDSPVREFNGVEWFPPIPAHPRIKYENYPGAT
jgi:hypothetical protein